MDPCLQIRIKNEDVVVAHEDVVAHWFASQVVE